MQKTILIVVAILCITGFSGVWAHADWTIEDGHKMHWPQMPDPFGWDVNATSPEVLADDWRCSETGVVKDIHFWGSWAWDEIGEISSFWIEIYSDVPDPDGPGGEYSHPGDDPLWFWEVPFPAVTVVQQSGTTQGWYDPSSPEGVYPENHYKWFQYNIDIPEPLWFEQKEGTIYWLAIQAVVPLVRAIASEDDIQQIQTWGWKSAVSTCQFNDDAVWFDGEIWQEMHEPPEFETSLDLAFVITGDGVDFGDAPDQPYPTLLVNNGARHVMSTLCLGATIDNENDGLQDPNALGDDNNASDDEDGVPFITRMIPGRQARAQVIVTGASATTPANLNAWVDFNDDGDWADQGEQIFTDYPVKSGTTTLTFSVPSGVTPTAQTFARFRLSTAPGVTYTGLASDGEVEDYEVAISRRSVLSWLLLLLGQ